MSMEALRSRSELRKEQERERRRLRDRQRRHSMSIEEREKHLARRRKNYQLRRQRAQSARLNSQNQFRQTSIATGVGDVTLRRNRIQLEASVLNSVAPVGSDQRQDRLVEESRKSASLEIPADMLAIIPGKLRLNRVKHLARVINVNPSNGVAAGLMMNGNATPNCKSVKVLRLNRIKCLARAMNTTGKESAAGENNRSIKERIKGISTNEDNEFVALLFRVNNSIVRPKSGTNLSQPYIIYKGQFYCSFLESFNQNHIHKIIRSRMRMISTAEQRSVEA